jgi:glycogen debranching enzyme
MADVQGLKADQRAWSDEADALARLINTLFWDAERSFYYDLALDGQRVLVKTVAAFWTLLAGVAKPHQVTALAAELNNPASFARNHRVPTLAANEPGYDPAGGYWCGAVWAPTTTMVIRGLERCGCHDLAREIALNDLEITGRVFGKTGTLWENYAPDSDAPGTPAKGDFVGWTGITPILFLLEYVVGLRPDATTQTLTWNLRSPSRVGCDRYRFNNRVASLQAVPTGTGDGAFEITVIADGEFTLRVQVNVATHDFAIRNGTQKFRT